MITEREQKIIDLARKGLDDETIIKSLPSHLTQKEQIIASLIKEGLTNKNIGLKLGISRRTVEIHRSHIMKKLGIQSSRQVLIDKLTNM